MRVEGGADEEAIVYDRKKDKLCTEEVLEYLKDLDGGKISRLPPNQAKGGEIYIYSSEGQPTKVNDAACDGYRWVNGGKRLQPKKKPRLFKTFYKMFVSENELGSSEFEKHVYQPLDRPHIQLIHYIGDEEKYKPTTHGNRKKGFVEHKRTCPSVLREIEEQVRTRDAIHVYREKTSNPTGETGLREGIMNCRNKKQVRNLRSKQLEKQRLSRDDVYNILQLAYHVEGLVWDIQIFPDLVSVIGSQDLLMEVNKLLELPSSTPLIFGYDTTFNWGIFMFPHLFSDMHSSSQSQLFRWHSSFMRGSTKSAMRHSLRIWYKEFQICRGVITVIVDRETGISNAIKKSLPNSQVLYCWNHLKSDVKHWLRKQGAKPEDLVVYINDINKILQCEKEVDYEELCNEWTSKWSKPLSLLLLSKLLSLGNSPRFHRGW